MSRIAGNCLHQSSRLKLRDKVLLHFPPVILGVREEESFSEIAIEVEDLL